jgi:predicted RNA-binding protein with RPS1 domain
LLALTKVPQTPDDDQRALKKTHTNKRPKEAKKAKKPLSDFQVGTTVAGKVVSIMPYGAFVDIGTTTDGLVHVSQMADEFVSDISTIVKVGDEVQVRIVNIETEINKISLSMRSESAERKPRPGGDARPAGAPGGDKRRTGGPKELPDEFKNFDDQKFLKGKVVSVLDYGCFVSINDQVEALVHISEMSDNRDSKAESLVKVGQEVRPDALLLPPPSSSSCFHDQPPINLISTAPPPSSLRMRHAAARPALPPVLPLRLHARRSPEGGLRRVPAKSGGTRDPGGDAGKASGGDLPGGPSIAARAPRPAASLHPRAAHRAPIPPSPRQRRRGINSRPRACRARPPTL